MCLEQRFTLYVCAQTLSVGESHNHLNNYIQHTIEKKDIFFYMQKISSISTIQVQSCDHPNRKKNDSATACVIFPTFLYTTC